MSISNEEQLISLEAQRRHYKTLIETRAIYLQVQEEMMRRANIRNGKTGRRRVYSSRYALSSIVFVKSVRMFFRRVHWNNRSRSKLNSFIVKLNAIKINGNYQLVFCLLEETKII